MGCLAGCCVVLGAWCGWFWDRSRESNVDQVDVLHLKLNHVQQGFVRARCSRYIRSFSGSGAYDDIILNMYMQS